jgi:carbamoyltransferase
MEWGPRTLGNRSIICNPRRADMKDIVNRKIKRRESFCPFAPSILKEHATDRFVADERRPVGALLQGRRAAGSGGPPALPQGGSACATARSWCRDDVPFMMQVLQVREEKGALIPAVVHVDRSSRLHTVYGQTNPIYWQLIIAFYGISGVPMVLNTSFNENEPVVCRPPEALDCFLRTKTDVLALAEWFIHCQ